MKRALNPFLALAPLGPLLFSAFCLNTYGQTTAEPIASRTATVDGAKLHYLTVGHGTPLILLHGYADVSDVDADHIGSAMALWFNVLVLLVQSFQKVPALRELAPSQTEPPLVAAQILARGLRHRAVSPRTSPRGVIGRLDWKKSRHCCARTAGESRSSACISANGSQTWNRVSPGFELT